LSDALVRCVQQVPSVAATPPHDVPGTEGIYDGSRLADGIRVGAGERVHEPAVDDVEAASASGR
jgi:hypothetical protein